MFGNHQQRKGCLGIIIKEGVFGNHHKGRGVWESSKKEGGVWESS